MPTLGVSFSASCHLSLSLMPTLGVSYSASCHPSLSDAYSGRVLFCFMPSHSVWCPLWACLILLHVISLCLMPTLGVSYSASCHPSLSDTHSGRVLFCFMSSLSVWCPLWACLFLLYVIPLCLMSTLGVSYSASCHPSLSDTHSGRVLFCFMSSLAVWCPLWACRNLLHVISLCLMPTLGVSYSASCHPSLSDTHYGRVLFCFMSSLSVWCPLWACLILLHVISLCLMSILGVSYSASCHLSLSDAHSGRVLFCFMSSLSVWYPLWACLILLHVISLSVWCPLWACLILLHVIPLSLMPPLGVSYSASCHPSLSDAHSGRVLFCFMSSLSLMPTLGVSYSASCHLSPSDAHSGRVLFCFMSSLSLSDTHSGRVLFCFMSSLSLSDAHSGRVLFCFMSRF